VARPRGRIGGTLVLDAEALSKLAADDAATYAYAKAAYNRHSSVVTAASTLAEVLRGTARDARLHRVLSRVAIVPIDQQAGRAAGELLGRTGMSGHQCALDALLAVVALAQPRPTLLLTSDPDDLTRLTEEPGRPRTQRIHVVHV
jgi:predicted nucleic acid-binding protein